MLCSRCSIKVPLLLGFFPELVDIYHFNQLWKEPSNKTVDFPRLGATGAAIATVQPDCHHGVVFGIYFNVSCNEEICFRLKGFHMEGSYFKKICIVGVPTIIMQSMTRVMSFGVNKLLLEYSSAATAVFGLNNALIPIVAYNAGAGQGQRIRRAIILSGVYSGAIGLFGTLIMEAFPVPNMMAFHPSGSMLEMGVAALRILSLSFVFGSVTVMASYALHKLMLKLYQALSGLKCSSRVSAK